MSQAKQFFYAFNFSRQLSLNIINSFILDTLDCSSSFSIFSFPHSFFNDVENVSFVSPTVLFHFTLVDNNLLVNSRARSAAKLLIIQMFSSSIQKVSIKKKGKCMECELCYSMNSVLLTFL